MKKIILFLLILLFNGCKEREITIPLPYEGDKMVVYAILSPSEIVKVLVSKTYPPTGKEIYTEGINNAEVLLYENTILIENLTYTANGIYTSASNFKPKAGFSYSLKVNSPTLPSITTGEEVIPALPVIESYQFDEKMESNLNKGKPAKKFFLTLKDNNSGSDFFSVSLFAVRDIRKAELTAFAIEQASGTDSPCFFQYSQQLMMSDICFQGSIYHFKRGYELDPIFLKRNLGGEDIDKVEGQIRTLSKSYYEYSRTRYTAFELERAFSPPYPRYSNIKGGYGIFAAYNETVLELSPD
ncbi:DUF4249 domain-containing protein [Emticicia agri]|uniref:DUF4249 domain-containing protein n=1 Tax=Emticicia agri TaxID=2492393 RepID=A0A4Q5LVM4_9BACT|nr:DUF4249 domain-containing protein [Emticicia agri]RYU93768.1 DUF4249 domain-containing protein [Emticicia agri]